MPISFRFHDSGKFFVSTYIGSISDDELRPAYVEFFARNDVPVNTPEMVDLSAADLSNLTPAGLAVFARWAEDFLRSRGEVAWKSARYIPGHPGRSKLVILEVQMQESPLISRTFSDWDEAVRWLTDPAPASLTTHPTR